MKLFARKGFIIVLVSVLLTGCAVQTGGQEKISELGYTVLPEKEVPEELRAKIEEKQQEEFYLTYADQGYLYIARGYGTQPTSGYSISVKEMYDTKDTICLKTTLIGPKNGEKIKEVESYPYIVVKTEYMEKEVMFE